MSRPPPPDGVLLVDKPAGPTSAEVVDWVRWALGTSVVGHCGTLDPAATGLLVVCVGAATKLAAVLTDADKRYQATIVLGRSTTTGDAEGETCEELKPDSTALARVEDTLLGLQGELSLAPPAFSAVRVDGKRAHELARAGEAPELAPRTMIVREVAAVRVEGTSATTTLTVSKGTYIRSLAEELGRRLGVPAHLQALRRLGAGDLRIDDAIGDFSVESRGPDPRGKPRYRLRLRSAALDRDGQAAALRAALVDPIDTVPPPRIASPSDDAGVDLLRRLGHGQPVSAEHPALAAPDAPGPVAVVSKHPRALILARWEGCGKGAILHTTRVVIAP